MCYKLSTTDYLVSSLLFQQCFQNLTHLDLFNNDVCNVDDYRAKMFKMLPSLKYLDDADVDGNEAEDSDAEDGQNGALDDEEGSDEDGESGPNPIYVSLSVDYATQIFFKLFGWSNMVM